MTVSLTADTRIFVGGSDWFETVTAVLGATVTGTADVTSEAILRQRAEQASVHAVSYQVELATMYATEITDRLRGRVGQPAHVAILTPLLSSVFPSDIPELPETAGSVDPITVEWSMTASGRGYYTAGGGTDFDLDQSTSTKAVSKLGDTAVLIVTDVSSTPPANFTLKKGADTQALPTSPGVHVITVDTKLQVSGVTLSVDSAASRSVSGILLAAALTPVAEDASS